MMKQASNDETMDNSLFYFAEDGSAYCKVHGAMNLLNGVWRCYTLYKGNDAGQYPKGIVPFKFVNRVCNAGVLA